MTENRLYEIARAMAQPEFYPHPAPKIERRETHISVVFLAGESVYKIKKPVAFDFLDFSTLEKRRRVCEEEVRLNRRLNDGVYHGVVPITEDGKRLTLNGGGPPVEYAVHMQRLDDRHTMAAMLAKGALGAQDFHNLSAKLAEFYRSAPAGRRIGGWDTVQKNCEENFSQMKPFVGSIISPPRFELILTATEGFLKRRRSLFEQRLQDGSVKDCHGDLRAEHIYFTPGGIQIIDCIEFNERMRFNDVASDVAFLVMDLDYQGAVAASAEMLEAFARRYGDLRLLALIDFYLCYRACVRLKVTCFRLRQEGLEDDLRRLLLERTRTFAALACRYAVRFAAPTVYVVMGMIASGKSTVAGALADAMDVDLLSSDRIRKRLFQGRSQKGPKASYGYGIYRPEARSHVYGNLLLEAEDRLRDRCSVVLDATFSRRKQRTEALRLARDAGARIVFVECRCPEAEIKRRLKSRENGTSLSDARLSIWKQFQESYEAPEEIPPPLRVKANTTRPTPDLIPEVFVASRQAAASADALYNFDNFL